MALSIKRICVPTDFSKAADHAMHFAAGLAQTYGSALYLLHVIDHAGPLLGHTDFTSDGEVARSYFKKLERAVNEAEQEDPESNEPPELPDLVKTIQAGVVDRMESMDKQWWDTLEVHRDSRYGHAAREINDYVKKFKIDLVVMGTHGHSKLSSVLLGSVTDRVVRTCSCPVTVIRHPEHRYTLTVD
ncbi:MAG: universal stress protein [Planctomycetota bacterium]